MLGEVYEVDPDTLARLDLLEDHPRHYAREVEVVEVESGLALAFIYVWRHGVDRELPPVVEDGDWRTHYRKEA